MRSIQIISLVSMLWIACCSNGEAEDAKIKPPVEKATPTKTEPKQFVDTKTPSPGHVRLCKMDDYVRTFDNHDCSEVSELLTELKAFKLWDLKPLSKLTHLEKLFFSAVPPVSLEPLAALSELKELGIWGLNCSWDAKGPTPDQVTLDLSPLKSLTKLKKIRTHCADITGLHGLANSSELDVLEFQNINPDILTPALAREFRKNYISKATDNQIRECYFWEKVDNHGPSIYCSTTRNIEKELEFFNLIDTGSIALATEATNIKLMIENDLQADLEPFRGLKNLKTLVIETNRALDLSPIGDLSNLETLSILNTSESDIYLNNLQALKKLKNLKKLQIFIDKDDVLSPIGQIQNLETLTLDLNTTHSIDMSALGALAKLRELSIQSNECSDNDKNSIIYDVAFLKNLKRLKDLDMKCMKVKSLSGFEGLTSLKHLDVNNVDSLDGFTSIGYLKRLSSFFAEGKQFKSLEGFQSLTKLSQLDIQMTDVDDLTPIKNLRNVSWLTISDTKVVDLTPIADWKSLVELNIQRTGIRDLTPISRWTYLSTFRGDHCSVTDYSALSKIRHPPDTIDTGEKVDSIIPFTKIKSLKWLNIGRFPLEEKPFVKKLPCCRYHETGLGLGNNFSEKEKDVIYPLCESVRIPGRVQERHGD